MADEPMRRLLAKVPDIGPKKTQHIHASSNGETLHVFMAPRPVQLEIAEQEDGTFFLLRLDSAKICVADTWHATVEAAKDQAAFEYGIRDPAAWHTP